MPESDSRVARIDPGSGQKVEQPVLVILKQMLPVYQQLCSKCLMSLMSRILSQLVTFSAQYNSDADITDAVCSNLKQGVSTLQDDIRPLTQEVSLKTVTIIFS